MNGICHMPEPEVGFRQRAMQRLGAGDRDQTLLVGAAEENGCSHQPCPIPCPIPIRLISQCSSIPEFALTRARTVSPSVSISWPVALPVLMRKLQCISDTCAPPTRK